MDQVNLALLQELIEIKKLTQLPDEPLDKFLRRAGVMATKNLIRNTVQLSVVDLVDGKKVLGAEATVPLDIFKKGKLAFPDGELSMPDIWNSISQPHVNTPDNKSVTKPVITAPAVTPDKPSNVPSGSTLAGMSADQIVACWIEQMRAKQNLSVSGITKEQINELKQKYTAHIVMGKAVHINALKLGDTVICFGQDIAAVEKHHKYTLENNDKVYAYIWGKSKALLKKVDGKLQPVQDFNSSDITVNSGVAAVEGASPVTKVTSLEDTPPMDRVSAEEFANSSGTITMTDVPTPDVMAGASVPTAHDNAAPQDLSTTVLPPEQKVVPDPIVPEAVVKATQWTPELEAKIGQILLSAPPHVPGDFKAGEGRTKLEGDVLKLELSYAYTAWVEISHENFSPSSEVGTTTANLRIVDGKIQVETTAPDVQKWLTETLATALETPTVASVTPETEATKPDDVTVPTPVPATATVPPVIAPLPAKATPGPLPTPDATNVENVDGIDHVINPPRAVPAPVTKVVSKDPKDIPTPPTAAVPAPVVPPTSIPPPKPRVLPFNYTELDYVKENIRATLKIPAAAKFSTNLSARVTSAKSIAELEKMTQDMLYTEEASAVKYLKSTDVQKTEIRQQVLDLVKGGKKNGLCDLLAKHSLTGQLENMSDVSSAFDSWPSKLIGNPPTPAGIRILLALSSNPDAFKSLTANLQSDAGIYGRLGNFNTSKDEVLQGLKTVQDLGPNAIVKKKLEAAIKHRADIQYYKGILCKTQPTHEVSKLFTDIASHTNPVTPADASQLAISAIMDGLLEHIFDTFQAPIHPNGFVGEHTGNITTQVTKIIPVKALTATTTQHQGVTLTPVEKVETVTKTGKYHDFTDPETRLEELNNWSNAKDANIADIELSLNARARTQHAGFTLDSFTNVGPDIN